MSITETLASIRHAESLIAATRLDIADSWRIVGSMLRDKRTNRSLTQAQASALIQRDASIVQRWEKGCIVAVEDVIKYLEKLEL